MQVCEDWEANAEVEPCLAQQAQQAQRGDAQSTLGGVLNVEAAVGRGPDGLR